MYWKSWFWIENRLIEKKFKLNQLIGRAILGIEYDFIAISKLIFRDITWHSHFIEYQLFGILLSHEISCSPFLFYYWLKRVQEHIPSIVQNKCSNLNLVMPLYFISSQFTKSQFARFVFKLGFQSDKTEKKQIFFIFH